MPFLHGRRLTQGLWGDGLQPRSGLSASSSLALPWLPSLTMSPTAIRTVRCNLVQRMERFTRHIQNQDLESHRAAP